MSNDSKLRSRAVEIARGFLPQVTPLLREALVRDLPGVAPRPIHGGRDVGALIAAGMPAWGLRNLDSLSEGEREPLQVAARAITALTMKAESIVPSIRNVLDSVGTTGVIFKGSATRRLHPLLEDRYYSDVDLLVDPADRDEVVRAFEAKGFQQARMFWEPRPGTALSFEHAVTLASPYGAALDLHRVIPPERWGRRLTRDRLVARAESRLGDSVLFAGRLDSILIGALSIFHGLENDVRPWRDVAVLLLSEDDWDRDAFIKEVRSRGLATPIYVVIAGLEHLSGRPIEMGAVLAPHVGNGELRRLGLIARARANSRGRIAHLLGMPGGSTWRYAARSLWPDDEYLRTHLGDRPHRRLRWLKHQVFRRRPTSDA